MPEDPSKAPLVWIDCEMTGLDCDQDQILSVACFVTDRKLNLLDEKGYYGVVHHEQDIMDSMGEWCTRVHGGSGLSAAVRYSTNTPEKIAKELLEYIKRFVKQPGYALLAGNTVHQDMAFLRKQPYKPITEHLSYRIYDVSVVKEVLRGLEGGTVAELLRNTPVKMRLHDARADILESIAEMRYYLNTAFKR